MFIFIFFREAIFQSLLNAISDSNSMAYNLV